MCALPPRPTAGTSDLDFGADASDNEASVLQTGFHSSTSAALAAQLCAAGFQSCCGRAQLQQW